MQLFRGDEHEADALPAHKRFDERVHGAAKFQVAAQTNRQVIQSALFAADGEQVAERLRRMLVAAVTGVDDRHAGVLRCYARRTLFVVAHGDDIRIAGYHANRIGNAFTLGSRTVLCTCKAQYLAAKAHHGRFKAQTRAGTRLVKERGKDFTFTLVGECGAVVCNAVRKVQQTQGLLKGKIQRVYEVS